MQYNLHTILATLVAGSIFFSFAVFGYAAPLEEVRRARLESRKCEHQRPKDDR